MNHSVEELNALVKSAFLRISEEVRSEYRLAGKKIPFWEDGKIVYKIPQEPPKSSPEAHSSSQRK